MWVCYLFNNIWLLQFFICSHLGLWTCLLESLSLCPHKFGHDVFALNFRKSFTSFFIPFWTHYSYTRELLSFHKFLSFLLFLLLIYSFNSWWYDRMQGVISSSLYLCEVTQTSLYPSMHLWSFMISIFSSSVLQFRYMSVVSCFWLFWRNCYEIVECLCDKMEHLE